LIIHVELFVMLRKV